MNSNQHSDAVELEKKRAIKEMDNERQNQEKGIKKA